MLLLVKNKLKKIKTFDSSYFEEEGTWNYLVLQPIYRSFKRISGVDGGNYIYFWKSKGLIDERINSVTAFSCKVTPQLSYYGTKTRVEFIGSCLKQVKATFNHWKIVNVYIIYEISKNFNITSYPTLEIFVGVSLTKNADIDQYKHFGYGIGFDRHGFFSHPNDGTGKYVILFRAGMSSSTEIDNRKKKLILAKGPTQELEHALSAEKMYSINFTEHKKNFVWVCIIMEHIVIYLLMVQKVANSIQKILRLWQIHYILEIFQNTGQ